MFSLLLLFVGHLAHHVWGQSGAYGQCGGKINSISLVKVAFTSSSSHRDWLVCRKFVYAQYGESKIFNYQDWSDNLRFGIHLYEIK